VIKKNKKNVRTRGENIRAFKKIMPGPTKEKGHWVIYGSKSREKAARLT